MIESNVISKILKENIIHNYNYLINRKDNIIVKKNMEIIIGFKKKNYNYLVNIKNLNNYLTYNLKIIREVILTSLTSKIEKKFV